MKSADNLFDKYRDSGILFSNDLNDRTVGVHSLSHPCFCCWVIPITVLPDHDLPGIIVSVKRLIADPVASVKNLRLCKCWRDQVSRPATGQYPNQKEDCGKMRQHSQMIWLFPAIRFGQWLSGRFWRHVKLFLFGLSESFFFNGHHRAWLQLRRRSHSNPWKIFQNRLLQILYEVASDIQKFTA